MSINKNSILFSISLFFIVLIFIVHMISYIGYSLTKEDQISLLTNRYFSTLYDVIVHEEKNYSNEELNNELKKHDLELSVLSLKELEEKAELVAKGPNWNLYEHEGYKYFFADDKFQTVLLKDNIKVRDKTLYLIFLTILLNLTFLFFYIFLIKKIKPIKDLKNKILKFSKGDLSVDTSSSGKDEISEVANEFNNARLELKQLTQSRNLFLRNIMHELKTPITKGRLIESLMSEKEYKVLLRKIFKRLDYLLNEFAKIEQITSKNTQIEKSNYKISKILDESLEMLMISKEAIIIDLEEDFTVNADLYYLALVLKNLIDNALKYGDGKPILESKNNTITIKSLGEKLANDFQEYLKPFNKKYEGSSESLGLGLYIVQSILKTHNLKLEYKYEDNQNIFFILFNKEKR